MNIYSCLKCYIVLLLLAFCQNIGFTQILSSNRIIYGGLWQPGLPNGIQSQNYTNIINVKVSIPKTNIVAIGDGINDDTIAIQTAINMATNMQVIYLPQGIYKTTNTLSFWDKNNLVLRGDGPEKTKILWFGTAGDIISFGHNYNVYGDGLIGSSFRGDTSITVSNGSKFAINDLIEIVQYFDKGNTNMVDPIYGKKIAQLAEIIAKSGNSLTISKPLYVDYVNTGPNGEYMIVNSYRNMSFCGIEDLYLERMNKIPGNNITFTGAKYCWIKNVESVKCANWSICLKRCYRCEVRDSYIHGCWYRTGNSGYGVTCYLYSTDNLVENNIFVKMRHSMITEGGGQGNVFGYNYATLNGDDGDTIDMQSDMCHHGAHPMWNLWEGNIAGCIRWDSTLGSSALNTALRNWCIARSETNQIYARWACDMEYWAISNNIIGNVFGMLNDKGVYNFDLPKSGKDVCVYRFGYDQFKTNNNPVVQPSTFLHGNYDFITDTTNWDTSTQSYVIPQSLYLKEKPSFFGNLPFPCIGSDLINKCTDNPAKIRYNNILNKSKTLSPPFNFRKM